MLETSGKPVVSNFEFFQLIRKMYGQPNGEKLFLRHDTPNGDDFKRLRRSLRKNGFIGRDRDYGHRMIRVLTVSDLPADEIVCLADPTCYLSHLSAMQRWGLTNRNSFALMLTRPDRATASDWLREIMRGQLEPGEETPFPLQLVSHPDMVRRRNISLHETKAAGAFIKTRSGHARLSTIGQTFLDMLQGPDLCGGMAHVVDVWSEHAETHFDEIVSAVDCASSNLVKSRAGYLLEEHLGFTNSTVESWKALGQRGGSRRLDPTKEFASTISETWMISLNV